MKTYHQGEKVGKGNYLNLESGEVVQAGEDGLVLPEGRFYRVPGPLLAVLGPVAGLAFILFLPFAGIASLFIIGVRKLKEHLKAGEDKYADETPAH